MNSVTLVQPPLTARNPLMVNPPLGLLTIASILEHNNFKVNIVDLNLQCFIDKRLNDIDLFLQFAIEYILKDNPRIVGFTSMALEAHICLSLSRILKKKKPDIKIVLGGPHFTSVSEEVVQRYDWVDLVVEGECENFVASAFCDLIDRSSKEEASCKNYRYKLNNKIIYGQMNVFGKSKTQILPSYHLINNEEYFSVNKDKIYCVENSRGCQLKCAYCYSTMHWGHGERRNILSNTITHLSFLKKLGVKKIFFVGDNMINSQEELILFCNALSKNNFMFEWACYGTLAHVNYKTIKVMSEVGCKSIFIGVDAVSEGSKKKYKKSYYKGWFKLREKLQICLDHDIVPTCAYLLSPHDSLNGINDTLKIFLFSKKLGCNATLNPLTIYNRTDLWENSNIRTSEEYSSLKVKLMIDTRDFNIENEYAMKFPDIFPFHRTTCDTTSYNFYTCLTFIASTIISNYRDTLYFAVINYEINLYGLVSRITRSCFDYLLTLKKIDTSILHNILFSGLCLEFRDKPVLLSILSYENFKFERIPNKPEYKVSLLVENIPIMANIENSKIIEMFVDPSIIGNSRHATTGEYGKIITSPIKVLLLWRFRKTKHYVLNHEAENFFLDLDNSSLEKSPIKLSRSLFRNLRNSLILSPVV